MGRLYYYIYQVAISLLVPAVLIRFLIRSIHQPEYRHRLFERTGFVPPQVPSGSIWIHAVSVGEVNAAKPLVDRLLESVDTPLLLSCVTPTGSAQAERLFGDRVAHIYAPIDAGFAVARTFRALRPSALIIVETELWPSLLCEARARKVPVAFANLRISDQTFTKAQSFLPLCRHAFEGVAVFCAQTDIDADRITALGAQRDKVYTTGNLKFSASVPEDTVHIATSLRERWGATRPVIVLASSHEGEEHGFLQLLTQLRETLPSLVSLIVPRHPERFEEVYQQISQFELKVVRRSQWSNEGTIDAEVVLVDSMGELLQMYAAADVAVVGGSFVAAGGHNVLEPLRVGTCVVFGPGMSNFREISQLLIDHDAGEQVDDFAKLGQTLVKLLSDPMYRSMRVKNGFQLLESQCDALERTVERLQAVLTPR